MIGTTPAEILRWTRGSGPTEPLWHAHYQGIDDTTELSFYDLIEVRVVKALRRAGVSLQAVRFAINYARDKFGVSHPLATLRFKTDGQEILAEALEQDGDLVSLSAKRPGQKVFSKIVDQSLNDLEFDNGEVVLWRPKRTTHIIIDPKRSFGTPILEDFGVSTQTLYNELSSYRDITRLAKAYEIPKALVAEAISFESRLEEQAKSADGQSPIRS
ncbi:hypothetical protein [Seohaeicola zhoushanensis]|uniref:DUF433 domain-containing protein n=1 Tax=Seohaeicola zhoushanensis TaxID=1569283 RepID=A0A8J3M891_9RHOB|nr:hypothetical protein [Seohaeicola zhoushanensis]GHF40796.1 hypothetical protein GCM10017056_10500 [Seohaeicola zhoushanensis]